MRTVFALALVFVVAAGCSEPEPPPAVAPRPPSPAPAPAPPEPPDAGPPESPLPPAPIDVAAFPAPMPNPDDVSSPEALARALLEDPERAERALQSLDAPDAWQVAVIARFATGRGERSFEVDPERPLPELPVPGAGLVDGGQAFVVREGTALREAKARRGRPAAILASLPLNTPVEITGLDGGVAGVRVQVATRAVFGATGDAADRVEATAQEGVVPRAALAAAPLSAAAVVAEARAQADDEAGRDRAVVLWRRALALTHSEAARRGLLEAAVAARRAPQVVEAALARNLARARSVSVATACRGDVPRATWVSAARALPKKLSADACVTELDLRASCPDDHPKTVAQSDRRRAWRDQQALGPTAWARFTIDGVNPRVAFLVTTPVSVRDPCSEFEELTFEAERGRVRRLELPLGSKALEVLVPLDAPAGVEVAVISAATEARAIAWLRSRARFRWTLGRGGALQVSLGTQDLGFELERDVSAASAALVPDRVCECE